MRQWVGAAARRRSRSWEMSQGGPVCMVVGQEKHLLVVGLCGALPVLRGAAAWASLVAACGAFVTGCCGTVHGCTDRQPPVAQHAEVRPQFDGNACLERQLWVRHRLVDESGQGVSGVDVCWVLDRFPAATPLAAQRSSGASITNEDGEFEFRTPLCNGLLSAWCQSGGKWFRLWGGEQQEVPKDRAKSPSAAPGEPENGRACTLRKDSGNDRVVALWVVDESDMGVPGATIEYVMSGSGGAPMSKFVAPFVTDAEGYAVSAPIPYGPWFCDVSAPGFARVRIGVVEKEANAEVTYTKVALARSQRVTIHSKEWRRWADGHHAVLVGYRAPQPYQMQWTWWASVMVGDGAWEWDVPVGQEWSIEVLGESRKMEFGPFVGTMQSDIYLE